MLLTNGNRKLFSSSILYSDAQKRSQVHGLRCIDDGSPDVGQIDVDAFDMRVAQIDAFQGGMREFGLYQFAVLEGDGGEFAIVDVAVAQVADGKSRLVYLTHGEIDVSGVAIFQRQVVQDGFCQAGAYQFAGDELYTEQSAFGK